MREVKLAPVTEVTQGDTYYKADSQTTEGVPVFERVTVTEITSWRERGEDQSLLNREANTGPEHVTYRVAAETGWIGGAKPGELFVEAADGFAALAYELVGTAVTVTMLVGEESGEKAEALVRYLLADDTIIDDLSTRPAYDKATHYLSRDGDVLAESVPHWSLWRGMRSGMCVSISGTVPVNEAIRQVLRDRLEHPSALDRALATGAPARRERRQKRRANLKPEQRVALREDLLGDESIEVLAERYGYAPSTLTQYRSLARTTQARGDGRWPLVLGGSANNG